MPPLRDVLADRPRIFFVGINPSLRSEQTGHHFAGKGNPFWRLLYESGLVPEPLQSSDDQRLAGFGLALANICPRATRAASELKGSEYEEGRVALARKIEKARPRVVAFVGLTVYQRFFHSRSRGPGPKPETIAGARVYVVPNPSGLNATFPGFADKLVWFERLRQFAEKLEAEGEPEAAAPNLRGASERPRKAP
jgi:TDG/mug DNA glycosylase family protein